MEIVDGGKVVKELPRLAHRMFRNYKLWSPQDFLAVKPLATKPQ